ncbi:MAG: iron-sulfur cluster repair di-iron protein [Calditrichaeota bacterium]|nr:iron-sulfur cluster repair di-iron protein [Calditrichota bacterium]
MAFTKDQQVADIVKQNPLTAKVFYKHGIDFCCGGKVPLDSSCSSHHADLYTVLAELNIVSSDLTEGKANQTFNSIDETIGHILDVYHKALYETMPIINQLITKVAKVHGENHPELIQIKHVFQELESELVQHMRKEEQVLFPMLLSLAENPDRFDKTKIANGPINQMELEHREAADLLLQLRKLSENYTAPADACNSYRGVFALLKEMEFELYKHIHIENNILHPMINTHV